MTSTAAAHQGDVETLYRLGKLVTASLDLDATLAAIVEAARQLTGAETSAILLLQPDDTLVIRAGQGAIAASVGVRVHAQSSIAGRALRENRVVLIEDMAAATDRARPDLDHRSGTRAYLAGPLSWRGEQLGVITLGATSAGALRQREVDLITELAEQAAAAVAHARAYANEQARRAELERLQEQLVHNEKMSAIGQLANGIAHEMNTPLGVIISNLSVLQQYGTGLIAVARAAQNTLEEPLAGTRAGPELARAVRSIDLEYMLEDLPQLIDESAASADRAATIVRSLATFAQRDAEQFSTVVIEETLETAVTLAWNTLKQHAKVIRDFGDVPPVFGHASELTQVFVHLLLNAAQALEDAVGAVTVSTSYQRDQVVVTITDTGRGIPPEHLAKVFDPFFTTRAPGDGTGMGLAVCHGILARHGGTIALDSTPGRGTVVSVSLPAAQAVSAAA